MATRGRPKSDQKRQQILIAAADLFTTQGYANTSMEQVASLRSAGSASNSRLVSTLQVWVDGCESFDKMIEVVTPAGTADARERWKRYAQMGAVLSNTAVDKLVSNA